MIPAIVGGAFGATAATASWVASSTSASVSLAPVATVAAGPVPGGLGAGVAAFGGTSTVGLTPFGPTTLTVII